MQVQRNSEYIRRTHAASRQQVEDPSLRIVQPALETMSSKQLEQFEKIFEGIKNEIAQEDSKAGLPRIKSSSPTPTLMVRAAQIKGRLWMSRRKSPSIASDDKLREVLEALISLLSISDSRVSATGFLNQLLELGVISDTAGLSQVLAYEYRIKDISNLSLTLEQLWEFSRGSKLSNHILNEMAKHINSADKPTEHEMSTLIYNWWLSIDPQFSGNMQTKSVADLLFRLSIIRDKNELKKMLGRSGCTGRIMTFSQFRILFSQSLLKQALIVILDRAGKFKISKKVTSSISPSLKLANYRRRLLFSAMNFTDTGIPMREGLRAIKVMLKTNDLKPREGSDFGE
jgi:hypothetical protein